MGRRCTFEYDISCDAREVVPVNVQAGILLIGGAENNAEGEKAATQWFLERARGGRYLVIRVGGIGRQADWICRHYRDWIHSAAELSIDSREAANHPTVIDKIRAADALFIAGGDQNLYRTYWEGTETEKALNYLINDKRIPVAGTSAGMAILGSYYYAPNSQGVLSSEILNDPFHFNTQTIYNSDFIRVPYLANVITDTHLDRLNTANPETRYGRILGFLARIIFDSNTSLENYAIGLEEGSFVAIDADGMAQVFGNGTARGQDAYFLRPLALPEQIGPGWPLIWNNNGQAVLVYRIAGTPEGAGSFDLKDWSTASGGQWEYWYTLGGLSGLRRQRVD